MADRITITITSEDDRSSETVDVTFARRLRHLADHLENPAFTDSYGDNIVDVDGEKIGEWQITPAEMLAPLPGICYVCGNGDEDLKPTRYGLTVGHLPAEWQNANVPMCPECRGE